jgi:hypothetical protein
MRAALVTCASSPQSVHSQRLSLWSSAARSGWGVAGTFHDSDASLDALHRLIARREIDVVLAWCDHFSRSLLDAISAAGCGLYSHEPAARPPDAEFDDQKGIVEDVQTARARVQGRRPGRPRVAPDVEAAIRAALAAGHGIRATARGLGVGISTVQRIRAERLDQAGSA